MTARAFQSTKLSRRKLSRLGVSATPVLPATALDHFAISVAASANAGDVVSVTLTAKQADGSTFTGYTGTVHATSSDPAATLPANYTFISADAGTKTFSFTLRTAGTQTVGFGDTTLGTTITSSGITVTVPAPVTGWDPRTALTGVTSWFRAGLLADANGAVVATGTDQVGTPHYTAPSAGLRPTRVNGAFGSNGGAVVSFSGGTFVGKVIDLHAGFSSSIGFRFRNLSALGMIAAIYADGDVANQQLQWFINPNGSVTVFVIHFGVNTGSAYNWIGRQTNPGTVNAGEDVVLTITYDGTASASGVKIFKGKTQVDTTDTINNSFGVWTGAPTRGFQVAGQGDVPANTAPMNVAEIINVSHAINSTELAAIADNLYTLYGLGTVTTQPTSSAVTIDRQVKVSTQVGMGFPSGTAGWGVQMMRIHRRANGDIYTNDLIQPTFPMAAGDEADYRRQIESWKWNGTNFTNQTITFEAGLQNGNTFENNGQLFVAGTPGGWQHVSSIRPPRLRLWDSTSGTVSDIGTGLWGGAEDGGAEWWYIGIGTDEVNHRMLVQRLILNPALPNSIGSPGANVPGYREIMLRNSSGVWSGPIRYTIPERYAYPFFFPIGTDGWVEYSTRDLSFADENITPPPGVSGGNAYAFDEVKRWYWSTTPTTAGPESSLTIRAERADQSYPDNRCQVIDAMVDHAGRHHLLIYARGPGTSYAYQTWHYVLNATTGAELGKVQVPLDASDKMRMFEDSTHRFWFVTVNQAVVNICSSSDADLAGNGYGVALTGASPLALTNLWSSEPGGGYLTDRLYIASPRSGGDTTLRDYADLLVPMYDSQYHAAFMMYVRVKVR